MKASGREQIARRSESGARPCTDLADPECALLLANVLDSVAAAIAILSGSNLRFELVNAAYRALTPRPDVDPLGSRYAEVWPHDGPVALRALQRVRETGEPCHIEDHEFADGGSVRRFSFHVSQVPWRGGGALLVVVWETTALWDARREAEATAQRALRRASELDHLDAAREDLVRMVSHDLRTPLSVILAQAELLQRDAAERPRIQERARSIARSGERMRSMIQDLLDATLLEAGQLRMTPTDVDLALFAREVIERHRGALAVDRVRMDACGSVPAYGDPERLERILVNLLSNALKYSPPQGEVTVRAERAAGGAVLAVQDHGVGIAPEDVPQVFDRFFRARGTRRPEGLGLGLYITHLLVCAHGGRIDVDTQLGCGSTFRVFLPARPLPWSGEPASLPRVPSSPDRLPPRRAEREGEDEGGSSPG